jgi:hypothetical protein
MLRENHAQMRSIAIYVSSFLRNILATCAKYGRFPIGADHLLLLFNQLDDAISDHSNIDEPSRELVR